MVRGLVPLLATVFLTGCNIQGSRQVIDDVANVRHYLIEAKKKLNNSEKNYNLSTNKSSTEIVSENYVNQPIITYKKYERKLSE